MKIQMFIIVLSAIIGFAPLSAARLDPESHAYLSDPKYEKYVDVQCYLVTKEQLGKVFGKSNYKIKQLTNKQLRKQDVYLLVRYKNQGCYAFLGELLCFLENPGNPIPVATSLTHPSDKDYRDCAIYIGNVILNDNDSVPKVKYEWDCLYTM